MVGVLLCGPSVAQVWPTRGPSNGAQKPKRPLGSWPTSLTFGHSSQWSPDRRPLGADSGGVACGPHTGSEWAGATARPCERASSTDSGRGGRLRCCPFIGRGESDLAATVRPRLIADGRFQRVSDRFQRERSSRLVRRSPQSAWASEHQAKSSLGSGSVPLQASRAGRLVADTKRDVNRRHDRRGRSQMRWLVVEEDVGAKDLQNLRLFDAPKKERVVH